MRLFSFLFTVRFWVLAWLAILFVGLTPVPPAIELVIVAALLAHVSWFLHRRMGRAAVARALARAERRKKRSSAGFVAGGLRKATGQSR